MEIIGGAVHFNDCMPGAEREVARSERASSQATYCTYERKRSAIAGNSPRKLETPRWNEPYSEAMKNNIIGVADFGCLVLRQGRGARQLVGFVAMRDPYMQRWDALPLDKPI